MTTKTLTIMEDAYSMLLDNKLENESFSDEIRRLLSKKTKRSLSDFFGIIPEKEGAAMLKDLEKIKSRELNFLRERAK